MIICFYRFIYVLRNYQLHYYLIKRFMTVILGIFEVSNIIFNKLRWGSANTKCRISLVTVTYGLVNKSSFTNTVMLIKYKIILCNTGMYLDCLCITPCIMFLMVSIHNVIERRDIKSTLLLLSFELCNNSQ